MGKVEEMVEEKIEAPKQLYVQVFGGGHAACYLDDPRKVHDNGKPVYQYVLIDTSNTRQRAERAAEEVCKYHVGSNLHPAYKKTIADIIAAEFEK